MLTWMLVTVALAADPAAGKVLYAASCTACHGAAGNGKGPAAVALKPKPTDLTAAAWWVGKTDEQVTVAIRAGRPGTSMAPFTEFSDAEVGDLVAYLRTFAAP
ncbi:MAG: cytochrome c [Pseudomonadota bacterium]|nr:cytochrome c [Pseudomonadota bacterium]